MENLTYLLIIICSCLICNLDAAINWSKSYNLKATLTIPSAEVKEPYEVWVNEEYKRARVDFYGGVDKLFREVSDTDHSKVTYYKVFPETTESEQNKLTCEELEVISGSTNIFYLPVKDFKFIANETIDGCNTQKWEYTITIKTYMTINQTSHHTIWISFNNSKPVPKRYEYKIYIGDTEFELYRHDYEYFNDTNISNDFYDEVKDLECVPSTESSSNTPLDPLLEFIDPEIEEERVRSEFEKFKENHAKKYSLSEHNFRRNIFKNNLRYINSINRQHKSYRLGINHLADLTDAELKKLSGIKTKKSYKSFKPTKQKAVKFSPAKTFIGAYNSSIENTPSPKTFDWRDYNAITPIKDQTILCGSCYAFTTAAAVESAAFISKGCKKLIELSEQAIIDCTWSDIEDNGNVGCLGGTYEFALQWIKKNGLPTRKQYGPYLAQEGQCHIKNMTNLTPIYQYSQINKRAENADEKIKTILRTYGPLMASINTSPKSFAFYKSGVYDDSKCRIEESKRDHAVTVVGYGQENGKDYWLIKNSWSTNWGDRGYMKIANAYNVCGIKNNLYFVKPKKKNHSNKCFTK